MDTLYTKLEQLKANLRDMGSVAVAFSSGVDSTFLLKVAHDVLGEQSIAVTASASFFPAREREEAEHFCKEHGIRQFFCDIHGLEIAGFRENPPNRCYLCKRALFEKFLEIASTQGIAVVAEGSNVDDEGDYRPGLKAVRELGIRSPLRAAGLTKAEIRRLSQEMGLPTWDKPSFACLASRFVYGESITEEKLLMVEQAEQLLQTLGFHQFRVRIHGRLARIEVLPEDLSRMLEKNTRQLIHTSLKALGFTYITLDLAGYRTGSMNETIDTTLS